jgi:HlyD family secretion protein
MILKIKNLILSHKIITVIIILIVIGGSYFLFRKNATGETRYVTDTVQKGNIMITVTGTGQVEATNTINLQAKTSGDITYLGVKVGQTVKEGELIASVDSRDAKLALENAKITLAKLIDAPDSLTLLQKQNSLVKTYNDSWNTVSSFITDMTAIISSMYDIYNTGFLSYQNTTGLTVGGKEKLNLAEKSYYDADISLEEVNKLYKTLTRESKEEEIKKLLIKAHDSSKVIANAVKNTETIFNYVVTSLDLGNNSNTSTTRADINSWLSDSNSYVNNLLSASNSIDESTQSLSDLLAGADSLDVKSAELTIANKQEAYSNCFIYAPFSGIVATLSAQVGEPSGSSIGTLITKQKVATISLNEVDIAKIKLGQKVTLTYDAIDDLTISGKVTEIDSIGTVSQGVVSYSIKISFDIDDDRIKPGMSVSAAIITDTTQDVLVVPNSAVKNQNEVSYVEVFDSPLEKSVIGVQGSPSIFPPKQIEVQTGLVDDTSTEINSGLNEGDIIVIKTITGTTSSVTSKTNTPSILGAVSGRGMGSGPRD